MSMPCRRSSVCSLPQCRVIRERQQLFEERRRIAGIVNAAARRRIGKVGAADQIAPAYLHRIDAELVRAALDQSLVDPGRLRPAGAAIGIDRHGVGIDAAHAQMQVRRAIKPGDGLRIGVAGNARREIAQITAERRQRIDLHGDDAAVAVEAHAGVGVVIARLGVGQERIGARRGPAHRPAQQLRGPDDGRDLDGEISLHAETAADVGRDDADFVLGDMQRVDRQPAPQIMRLLGRGVERVAIGRGIVFAEIGARLQRIGGKPAVVQRRARRLWRRRPARLSVFSRLPRSISNTMLVPKRSCMSGAPGAIAARGSHTPGSGS